MVFAAALGAVACKAREFNNDSSESSISGPGGRSHIAFDAVSSFEKVKGLEVGWCYFNEDTNFQPKPIESGLYQEDFSSDPSNSDKDIIKTYKVDYTLRQYTSAHQYAIRGELERPTGQMYTPQYNAVAAVNSEIGDAAGDATNQAMLGIMCSPDVVDAAKQIDSAIAAPGKTKTYSDLVVTCRDGKVASVRKSSVGKLPASEYQWIVGKLKALSASPSNQTKLNCPQSIQQIGVSRGKLVKTVVCTDNGRNCVNQ